MIWLSICTGLLVACAAPEESAKKEPSTTKEATTKETMTETGLDDSTKEATQTTIDSQARVRALLDFEDEREREFAQRGLIAAPEELEIKDETGKFVWSQKAYDFLNQEAPDSANPSLWRHTQMNNIYGLFEVTEGIYQVRGYDMTNITFVEGDSGWIIFDPLMSVECSKAAMELVNKELGERPVKAVVMSHPHIDHYGGIKGIISEEDNVPIIAPEHFEEHAISENVYAGNAMGRRAGYQYGTFLDPSEQGSLAIGIGMGQSKGTVSYISPNDLITKTGETRTIDGVTMEFQMTPGTEAPAEMNTWFADKKALWMAENCTGTLHNLYTLRGAQVRDGNDWALYIMEAITLYGDDVEVVFQAHNWPHWGNEEILEYMENTAAVYKFINDQTLMYINQGYTSNEIANMIELPKALEKNWYTRQYYGTVSHNSKAVYQKYMGWYDANPVHLAQLGPSESAKKYVEYLGDTDEVIKKAQEDFAKGEYQWVAEIMNVLVFADPTNEDARYLCADAMEQLGYAAESGTWRNAYLSGAKELREGAINDDKYRANGSSDTMQAMTPKMIFDFMGIKLNSNEAQDLNFKINFAFTDGNPYLVTVKSGVLLYQENRTEPDADLTLNISEKQMFAVMSGELENIEMTGNPEVLKSLLQNMQEFEHFFNIVEPKTIDGPTTKTTQSLLKELSMDEKWSVLEEAYIYTFPLMLMDATKAKMTNTIEATHKQAPINQFIHSQNLSNAQMRDVVTPNVDTIYSQVFLDLSKDGIVFYKPSTERFCSVEIMDAYTNCVKVLGTGGDTQEEKTYLLAGPNFEGEVPDDMTKVDIPTNSAWVLIRTAVLGLDDLENVYAIQQEMKVGALATWQTGAEASIGSFIEGLNEITPLERELSLPPKDFFAQANKLMKENPPPVADKEILEKMAQIGIGPEQTFDITQFGTPEEIKPKWEEMLKGIKVKLKAIGADYTIALDDWSYYGEPIAEFGTEYDYRAFIALGGLGANPNYVAIYPRLDMVNGEALDGSKSYVIHFEKDELPPVKENGFWSITAYGADNFLIDNELNRYLINDRSKLKYNADGSLDILLQANAPEDKSMMGNWLPVASNYHLYMRIYMPDESILEGKWKSPTIKEVE